MNCKVSKVATAIFFCQKSNPIIASNKMMRPIWAASGGCSSCCQKIKTKQKINTATKDCGALSGQVLINKKGRTSSAVNSIKVVKITRSKVESRCTSIPPM